MIDLPVSALVSITIGLLLVAFNGKMASLQKKYAKGKEDLVSRRITKRSFRDIRIYSVFVGVGLILLGVIEILQTLH